MTVADSTFSANTATTNGGAINLMDTNTMTATNTAFTGNKTTKSAANKGGAAVYVREHQRELRRLHLHREHRRREYRQRRRRAVLYAVSASQTAITVSGSTFTGNTAPNGGAIGLSDGRQLPQRPGDRELDGLHLHRQQRGRQGRRDCHSVQL